MKHQNMALEYYESSGSPLDVAISLNQRANIYKLKGDLPRALADYQKGLTLSQPYNIPGLNKALIGIPAMCIYE